MCEYVGVHVGVYINNLFTISFCVRSALLERMPLPDVNASASVNDPNGAGESLPTEGKICVLYDS